MDTCASRSLRGSWWAFRDSNPGPTGYEPAALTNWAKGPYPWYKVRAATFMAAAPPVWLEQTTPRLTAACSTDWAKEEYSEPEGLVSGSLCWRWPIFPARRQASIVGTGELNFRVRNGNGWTLTAKNTNCKWLLPNTTILNPCCQGEICLHPENWTMGRWEARPPCIN